MIDRIEYFQRLEVELLALKKQLLWVFDDTSGDKQFQEFIDVGEYGLAFEEITFRLIEYGCEIPRSIFEHVDYLARKMHIPEEHWKPIKVRE